MKMTKMTKLALGMGGIVTLIMGNVLFTANNHVTTVEENVNLTVSNNNLKQENTKLTAQVTELKETADSLQIVGDSLQTTLQTTVDNYENKIVEARQDMDSNHDDAKPYRIAIPIPEVSDSTK